MEVKSTDLFQIKLIIIGNYVLGRLLRNVKGDCKSLFMLNFIPLAVVLSYLEY